MSIINANQTNASEPIHVKDLPLFGSNRINNLINIGDYLIFISTFTAMMRFTYVAYAYVSYSLDTNAKLKKTTNLTEKQKILNEQLKKEQTMIAHLGRACFSFIPGWNLLTIPYDLLIAGRSFNLMIVGQVNAPTFWV